MLADPTRIKLLDRLRTGEATVQELTGAVGTTQQNVSKHLGVLSLEDTTTMGHSTMESRTKSTDTNLTNAPDGTGTHSQLRNAP